MLTVFQMVVQVGQALLHWKLSAHHYYYEPVIIMDNNAISWARIIFEFKFQALPNALSVLVSLRGPSLSGLNQNLCHLKCIT